MSEALKERIARAICRERCAQRGEPPCYRPDIGGDVHECCGPLATVAMLAMLPVTEGE